MWKLIKIIILILAFGFGSLVFWMNLTPGYFQQRGCVFGYYTDQEIERQLQSLPGNIVVDCSSTASAQFLMALAKLDFNKGITVAPTVGSICSLNQLYQDRNSCQCPEGYSIARYPDEGPGPGPDGKVWVSSSGYACELK